MKVIKKFMMFRAIMAFILGLLTITAAIGQEIEPATGIAKVCRVVYVGVPTRSSIKVHYTHCVGAEVKVQELQMLSKEDPFYVAENTRFRITCWDVTGRGEECRKNPRPLLDVRASFPSNEIWIARCGSDASGKQSCEWSKK